MLDTACARLSLGQNSTPPRLEDVQRQLDSLEVQKRVLERETKIGADHQEKLELIEEQIAAAKEDEAVLKEQWEKEKALIEKIRKLQQSLESAEKEGSESAGKETEIQAELKQVEAELETLQGERGMMRVSVDAQIVGEVISAWTGIPLGKMVRNEIETVLTLDEHLKKRVIGQDHALSAIAQRILTSRANMDDPVKPVGVFLLVGPERRWKDGDCHCACRRALWRRAQHDHDQHVGVSGSAHGFNAEGIASGIRGLRRGRRID